MEVLQGIFYDSNKEWYEQDYRLIELANQVEQTQPIEVNIETITIGNTTQSRVKYSVWLHTTEMGDFRFRIDMNYMFDITSPAFLTKTKHDTITLCKVDENLNDIEDEYIA
jgi:hypothetical protein